MICKYFVFTNLVSFCSDVIGCQVEQNQDEGEVRTKNGSVSMPHLSSSESDISVDESDYLPEDSSSSQSGRSSACDKLTGMQEYPEITEKPRRRKRQPHKWKRNIQKKRRLEGKEYVSTTGVLVPAVQMKASCKKTCRLKCFELPEEQRVNIFQTYYSMGDYSRQRDFIHANTVKQLTKTKTTQNKSRRSYSITYFLPIDGVRKKVCKSMFLNTLGIKKGVVDIAMQKRSKENVAAADGRGKGKSPSLDPAIVEGIKTHIKSFPCVPSHYCRAGTARKYLDSSLNLATMYRMYSQHCNDVDQPKAKLSAYRKIFRDDFNLGFHIPKKDQCRICNNFDKSSESTENMKIEYEAHQICKNEAREEKNKDKQVAVASGNIISCNFDLQQVLLCPSDPTNNALFYKRRLATYNFTIFNVATKQGDCLIWHEGQGGRGSCEIASCLFIYFQSLPNTINEVRCFSDRCSGQNLNKYVVAMCMYAVQVIKNVQVIELKFLQPGHSEMECDSMHSTIGTEFKRVGKALWPGDWKTVARGARKKGDKPYSIHDIQSDDIINWKSFADDYLTIRKTDSNSQQVNFQKICWFRFTKEIPYEYEFKESFTADHFRRVDCRKTALRRLSRIALLPCYPHGHPITEAKYKDLMSLFSMKPAAISRDYFDFYSSLPHGIVNVEEDDD